MHTDKSVDPECLAKNDFFSLFYLYKILILKFMEYIKLKWFIKWT